MSWSACAWLPLLSRESLSRVPACKILFWLSFLQDAGRVEEMLIPPGVVSPMLPTNKRGAQAGERPGDALWRLRRPAGGWERAVGLCVVGMSTGSKSHLAEPPGFRSQQPWEPGDKGGCHLIPRNPNLTLQIMKRTLHNVFSKY